MFFVMGEEDRLFRLSLAVLPIIEHVPLIGYICAFCQNVALGCGMFVTLLER